MNMRVIASSVFCVSFISSPFILAVNTPQDLLLCAIKNNSGIGVQQALVDVVKQGKDGKSPESILLKAIVAGTTDEIKQAVLPVLEQGKNNMSPVTWAVLLKRPNAVNALLECGAKVDSSILSSAVKLRDLEMALLFIKHGIDLSAYFDDFIKIAIQEPATTFSLKLIQEAINHGYDVNRVWEMYSYDNLLIHLHSNVVSLLIKNGANPNYIIKGTIYKTGELLSLPVLTWAVTHGNGLNVVDVLINAGADVNYSVQARGKIYSPLTWAVEWNKTLVIPTLLEHGATL